MFVESAADRVQRFPQYHGMDVHGSFVVVPVAAFEETPGVLSFGFLEPRHFTDDDRRYIAAVVEACAQALGRASLLEAEQRSRARLRTLLDFSEQLAAIDDPEAVLHATARFAATRIGRFAIVHAREPNGTLRQAAIAHADSSLQPALQDLIDRGVGGRDVIMKAADTGLGATFGALHEVLVPRRTSEREGRRSGRTRSTGCGPCPASSSR